MTDLQMSQSGPYFQKIILLAAACFDFAPQADFGHKVVILNSAQDAGVQNQNLHQVCT